MGGQPMDGKNGLMADPVKCTMEKELQEAITALYTGAEYSNREARRCSCINYNALLPPSKVSCIAIPLGQA
jgi:hypothetical protein